MKKLTKTLSIFMAVLIGVIMPIFGMNASAAAKSSEKTYKEPKIITTVLNVVTCAVELPLITTYAVVVGTSNLIHGGIKVKENESKFVNFFKNIYQGIKEIAYITKTNFIIHQAVCGEEVPWLI